MIQFLAGGKAIAFLSGAVVGAVALPVLKSKTVRKATVSVLATGLSAKEQAEHTWGTVQENLSDLYEEAKTKKTEKDLQDLEDLFGSFSQNDIDWGDDDESDPFDNLDAFLGDDDSTTSEDDIDIF